MRSQFLVFITLLLFITSCNSKNKKDIYVFKSILKNDSIYLLVDNNKIGQIPYIDTTQTINITSNARLICLSNGKHEISAKDKNGIYLSSVIIEISGNNINMGSVNYSKNRTTATIIKNSNDYSFKDRSSNELFIFSLE